jgi:hypothetical protein
MRKDYGVRKKMMGGGMTKKRTMMKNGGFKTEFQRMDKKFPSSLLMVKVQKILAKLK